jgi:hypothetical protein
MSMNVSPTHVMSTEPVPTLMALTAALVTMVTLVMDSHAKTSTNVTLMSVVTIPPVPISLVASHALALTASMVMPWTVVLTFANVVTLNSMNVTLTQCAQTLMADTHVLVTLDTLVTVNLVLMTMNVLFQNLSQLIQHVKIPKAALSSLVLLASKRLMIFVSISTSAKMPPSAQPTLPASTPLAVSDVIATPDSPRTQKLTNAMMLTNVSKVLMIVTRTPLAPTVSDHSTVLVTMAGLVMVNHAWTLTNVLLCSSVPWVHPNHAVTLDNVPTLTVRTLVHV